jgi:Carboxypeptidase regulatory-like domain
MTSPWARRAWMAVAVAALLVAGEVASVPTATEVGLAEGESSRPPGDPPGAPGALAALDAGTELLAGRVVDAEGSAVSGAEVLLYAAASLPREQRCPVCGKRLLDCDQPETVQRVVDRLDRGTLLPVPLARAVSDPAGAFRFEAAPAAARWLVARSGAQVGAGTGSAPLVVSPRAEVLLQTSDGVGGVRPGARLWVLSPDTLEAREVVTDAKGQAPTGPLSSATASLVLAGTDTGFLPASAPVEAAPLELVTPRTLLVHTVCAGAPVEASVGFALHGQPRTQRSTRGTLRLEGLAPDRLLLRAFTDTLASPEVFAEVDRGQSELTLELRRSSRLQLHVTDEEDRPLEHLRVRLQSPEGFVLLRDPTGSEAAALSLGPLAEGEYELALSAPGFLEQRRVVDLSPGEHLLASVMHRSVAIRGRVVDRAGRPVAEAQLTAFSTSPMTASAVSGPDGGFELPLPAGAEVVLTVVAPSVGRAELKAAAPAEVLIALAPGAGLELQLRDPGGSALPSAQARLERLGERPVELELDEAGHGLCWGLRPGTWTLHVEGEGLLAQARQVTLSEGHLEAQTVTLDPGAVLEGVVVDWEGRPVVGAAISSPASGTRLTEDDGRFVVQGLPSGPVKLEVALPWGDSIPEATYQAPAKGLVLKAPPTRSVRGEVVDEAGAPITEFTVDTQQVSAADGRFVAMARQPEIEVAAGGFRPDRVPVPASGDVGRLVLRPLARVEGEVRDAQGQPAAGVRVRLLPVGEETVTRADGHFSLPLLEAEDPKEVSVLVATRGASVVRAAVQPGTANRLVLGQGTRVVGRLAGPWARAGVTVRAEANSEPFVTREALSEPLGRFELELFPGPWTFRVLGMERAVSLEVSGDRQEVELGGELGRCALEVQASVDVLSVLLVPRGLPLSLNQPGALVLGGSPRGYPIVHGGLPCGAFTLAVDFHTSQQVAEVTLERRTVFQAVPEEASPGP